MENAALVALLWYVFAVQVWSASSGMRLKPRLSGRFAPGDRLYAVAVAASTQVDARRKAFQRRFQSLNFLREKQSDIVRRRAWCGLMEIEK